MPMLMNRLTLELVTEAKPKHIAIGARSVRSSGSTKAIIAAAPSSACSDVQSDVPKAAVNERRLTNR